MPMNCLAFNIIESSAIIGPSAERPDVSIVSKNSCMSIISLLAFPKMSENTRNVKKLRGILKILQLNCYV